MQPNLFDDLYEQFVADKNEDEPTSVSRFIAYCRRRMAERRVTGVQYNGSGQASLVFDDGNTHTLGDPTVGSPMIAGSYAFTQQPRQLDRPPTIEAQSVSFTAKQQ
jgi:hypothetical protein